MKKYMFPVLTVAIITVVGFVAKYAGTGAGTASFMWLNQPKTPSMLSK